MPNEVTLDHIAKAAEWAAHAQATCELDGQQRRYDQSQWDCGTSCCIWGAASILAGNGPAKKGPPTEWLSLDAKHRLIGALLFSQYTTPERIQDILAREDLTGADLTHANLTDANLTCANLARANLTGANLTYANLTDADLTGADLTGANLTRANLTGADLTGADLIDANLTRANLTDANLTGADLTRANLTGAVMKVGNVFVTIK